MDWYSLLTISVISVWIDPFLPILTGVYHIWSIYVTLKTPRMLILPKEVQKGFLLIHGQFTGLIVHLFRVVLNNFI